MTQNRQGVLSAIGAYIIWGLLPIYWKFLSDVGSIEIMVNRIIWSCISTIIVLLLIKQGTQLKRDIVQLWQHKKQFFSLFAASLFISVNWFIYIWAVNNDYLYQTSLGYYINPLISVLFGVVFFKERLTPSTWIAVSLATIGVLAMTISSGQVPFIALILAVSFGIYGVLKKRVQLDATRGLAIETLFLLPFALVGYIVLSWNEPPMLFTGDATTVTLLLLSGVVTAVPLILFATAAQRIPLILLGFIQYLSPSIVLLLGLFVYNEPFTTAELIGFSAIWAAIVIFSVGNIMATQRMKRQQEVK